MKNRFKRTFRAVAAVLMVACLALLCLAAVPVLSCDLGPPQEFAAVSILTTAPVMQTDNKSACVTGTNHSTMKATHTEARDATTSLDAVTGAAPPLRC